MVQDLKTNQKLTMLMVKIDRLAAQLLFIIIILFGITGYGLTKGLIDRQLAEVLHLGYLGAIGLICFVIHTSWAFHLTLKRKGAWNKTTKILLFTFYIALILFFGYLNFFYKNNNSKYPATNSQSAIATNTNNTIYTAATLKNYNGQNGQPAYVAVDGVVYDVSLEFKNGRHHGYSAGQDLSEAFHNQHPDSFLNGLTVVGTYQVK